MHPCLTLHISFLCAVKLCCNKAITVVIMKLRSHIMWQLIGMEQSFATLWYDEITIVQLSSTLGSHDLESDLTIFIRIRTMSQLAMHP